MLNRGILTVTKNERNKVDRDPCYPIVVAFLNCFVERKAEENAVVDEEGLPCASNA